MLFNHFLSLLRCTGLVVALVGCSSGGSGGSASGGGGGATAPTSSDIAAFRGRITTNAPTTRGTLVLADSFAEGTTSHGFSVKRVAEGALGAYATSHVKVETCEVFTTNTSGGTLDFAKPDFFNECAADYSNVKVVSASLLYEASSSTRNLPPRGDFVGITITGNVQNFQENCIGTTDLPKTQTAWCGLNDDFIRAAVRNGKTLFVTGTASSGARDAGALPCGEVAQAICLGAPFSVGGLRGTSFAAPVVAAGVALIRAQWPSLSARSSTALVLRCGRAKSGGVSASLGTGLLDFACLYTPTGGLALPSGAAIAGGLGAATFALSEAQAHDALGRTFAIAATDRRTGAPGWRTPFSDPLGAVSTNGLALTRDSASRAPMVAWTHSLGASCRLGAMAVHEAAAFAGAHGVGSFALGDTAGVAGALACAVPLAEGIRLRAGVSHAGHRMVRAAGGSALRRLEGAQTTLAAAVDTNLAPGIRLGLETRRGLGLRGAARLGNQSLTLRPRAWTQTRLAFQADF